MQNYGYYAQHEAKAQWFNFFLFWEKTCQPQTMISSIGNLNISVC